MNGRDWRCQVASFNCELNSEVVICEIIKKESVESNKLYK